MLVLIFILVCFSVLPYNFTIVNAAQESVIYYARVMTPDCYLYKTPYDTGGYDNLYFIIPQTYFVQLTDASGDYFAANYMNFKGYVKKSCVRSIIGIPTTPYNNDAIFRVFYTPSQIMRERPHGSSREILTIPQYEFVKFIGTIEGDDLFLERTNIWYYCSYTTDKENFGYVYSDFCDQESGFVANNEAVDYTDFPDFSPKNVDADDKSFNKKATGIVIAVLMIPALIFVFIAIKGSRLINKENSKSKSKEIKEY